MSSMAKTGLPRYHSQQYTNGDKCDLTGQPRQAEVRVGVEVLMIRNTYCTEKNHHNTVVSISNEVNSMCSAKRGLPVFPLACRKCIFLLYLFLKKTF